MNEKVSVEEARSAALALLTRRAYTRKELEEKLRKKSFAAETIKEVIAEFLQKRYLDDYAYALRLAESSLKRKGWSERRTDWALKAKGIAAEERQRALETVYGQVDEVAVAKEAVRKKYKSSSSRDPQKVKRQMAGYLTRRGFSTEVIVRALRDLFSDKDIEE